MTDGSTSDGFTRRGALALAAVGLSALAGCGYRPGPGDVRWSTAVGNRTLVSVADLACAWTRRRRFYDFDAEEWTAGAYVSAFDAGDGDERWLRELPPTGPPASDGNALYAGTEDATVVSLAADGSTRWRAPVRGFPRWVAVHDGDCYAATDDALYAHGPDGAERWRRPFEGDGRAMAAADGGVCFPVETDEGRMLRLVADGEVRWTVQPFRNPEFHGTDAPAVRGDEVYVVDHGGVAAVDVADGTRHWSHSHDGGGRVGRPVVADGRLFYVHDGALFVRSAIAGTEQWTFRPSRFRGAVSDPVVAEGVAYVADDGDLYALDAESGDERWRAGTDDVSSVEFAIGEDLLVTTTGGDLRSHQRARR